MTKAGIVEDIAVIVDRFLETVQDKLVEHRRVDLRKFGNFIIKTRKARIARNPRTNKPVKIPVREVPIFKPSRLFKEKVNRHLKDKEV